MRKSHRFLAEAIVILLVGWAGLGPASAQDVLERRVSVPKLISQVDLDCSFFVMTEAPKIRIAGPVQEGEFRLLTNGRQFYAESLPGAPVIEADSRWTIVEWGPRVYGTNPSGILGNVVFRRGRAKAVRAEGARIVMDIEKSCGVIETGCFLVPYEKGEIIAGDELPYEVAFNEAGVPAGRVVFMESETMQVGARGFWALIDIGADQGLKVSDQLTLFRAEKKKRPRPIANAVVIQTGNRWAVVKILNSRDAIQKGDFAQARPVE